ncbi:MAG: hypothetical protein EA376_10960 [Phycisphaeraceae bacterium]|nr:MAG: hypothetical protein EA376_10960 [Phycisphaeraceae bacterium]
MVTSGKDGSAQFAVYLPNASKVELIGDFTEWCERPRTLRRDENGWWRGSESLPTGDYQFCYLVDGVARIPDFAASGICRNQEGGWVSQLRIDAADTKEAAPKKVKRVRTTTRTRRVSA